MTERIASTLDISKKDKILSLIMLIVVGTFTNYIYVLTVYVQPLSEFHGWSMNMIVTAFSASYAVMIPAYAIGGFVTAKFGMKKILVVSAGAYGLSILVSGLVTNVYLFIVFMGVLSSFALYGVFMASLALINVMFPDTKGTAMGLLYGFQTLGAAAFSPLANFFIINYSVTTSLIIQGAAFTVIMIAGSLFVKDPTKGNIELMNKIQEQADAEEKAEALKGKTDIPSMRWKKSLKHPGIWLVLSSMVFIQMIGNVITSDSVYLATTNYGVSSTTAAFTATVFALGCAVGAIVLGTVSDKIGPYSTTFWVGIIDGIILLILVLLGTDNYTYFVIMVAVQGFTYNGMCALNAVMVADAYHPDDLGAMMALVGVGYTVVGIIGPQLGLIMPFVPMLIVCAICSVIGGFLSKSAAKSLTKYYKGIGSQVVVK